MLSLNSLNSAKMTKPMLHELGYIKDPFNIFDFNGWKDVGLTHKRLLFITPESFRQLIM